MAHSEPPRVLAADVRPVRPLGSCYGVSLPRDALEELGVVDDEGRVDDSLAQARVTVRDDGTIGVDLSDVGRDPRE